MRLSRLSIELKMAAKFSKLVQEHLDHQEKLGKIWNQALDKARDQIRKKYQAKKHEIKEDIHKQKTKERELMDQIVANQKLTADELSRMCGELQGGMSDQGLQDFKSQQLDRYWTEMGREFEVVLDRQRDKIQRLDQSPGTGVRGQKRIELMEKQKTICDQRSQKWEEFNRKVDTIRKEIDKIQTSIEELDRQEKEKLEHVLKKSRENDQKDRQKTWKKFFEDCKK